MCTRLAKRRVRVVAARAAIATQGGVEYNVEGNPFPDYMRLVREVRPTQATLVPDDPEQATSDHGFTLRDGESLSDAARRLQPLVTEGGSQLRVAPLQHRLMPALGDAGPQLAGDLRRTRLADNGATEGGRLRSSSLESSAAE